MAARSRRLLFESLENRELLSVSPTEFNDIRAQYADLNLSANMADYNVIEITAAQLSDTALRNAIDTAAATTKDDLIVVRTTATQNKITLGGSELALNINASLYGSVTIVSLGTADSFTIDANGASRVFKIDGGTEVALAGVTITGGVTDDDGGGIINDGTLAVTNCMIVGNTAAISGGGIFNGGALTVTSSIISDNAVEAMGCGGGLYLYIGSETLITNSLIVGNVSDLPVAGIGSIKMFGGGICSHNSSLTIINSTISGNGDSGIVCTNSTLALYNTIVARNLSSAGCNIHISSSTISGSNNLIGYIYRQGDSLDYLLNWGDNNILDAYWPLPVLIDPIASNYYLEAGSPAINAGNNDYAIAVGLTHDLAGNPRIFNGTVDIGAYEYQFVELAAPMLGDVLASDSSTINVNWSTVDNASGYLIQYATDSAFTTNVGTVAINSQSTTSTDIISLLPNQLYYVRVMATGTGAYSNSDYSVSKSAAKLSAPTLGDVLATGSGTISVAWNSVTNSSGYTVQYATNSAFTTGVGTVNMRGMSMTLSGLSANTLYYVRVMATGTGAYSNSDYSASKSATTDKIKLSAPTLGNVLATGSGTISVAWNSVTNFSGYTVQYATNSAFTTGVGTANTTGTSMTLSGLSANTLYYVRVMAIGTGAYSNSDYSASKSATTDKVKLSAPTLTVGTVTTNSVTLSWNAITGASGYRIEKSDDNGSSWLLVETIANGSTTSTPATGLMVNTPYLFRIKATGTGQYSDSDWSSHYSARTDIELGAPQVVVTNQIASVKLDWLAVPGADRYEILRQNSNGSWTTLAYTTALQYVDTSATANVAMSYIVRACRGSTVSGFNIVYGRALPNLGVPQVAVTNQPGSVKLTWSLIAGADKYEILRQNSDGSWTSLAYTTTLQYIDMAATPNVAMSYIVRSCAGTSVSGFNIVYGRALPNLGVPQVAVTNQPGSVKLTWSLIAGADKYEILRQNSDGSWTSLAYTTTLQIDIAATPNVAMSYIVRSCAGTSVSGFTIVYGKALPNLGIPQVAVTNQAGGVKLTWATVTGADRYEILRQNSNGSWMTLGYTAALQYVDTAATPNVAASYIVRACSGASVSGFNIVYGRALLNLGIPQVAVTNQPGNVKLTWSVIAGADRYEILRQNSNGSWTTLGYTTALQYVDTSVTPNVATSYIVRSCQGSTVSGFTIVYGRALPNSASSASFFALSESEIDELFFLPIA